MKSASPFRRLGVLAAIALAAGCQQSETTTARDESSGPHSPPAALEQGAPTPAETAHAPPPALTSDPFVAPAAYENLAPVDLAYQAITPEESVRIFLAALKAGDKDRARQLLSHTARAAMERDQFSLHPPGSPNATFTVGEVDYLGENAVTARGAHVLSTWTETTAQGKAEEFELVWIVVREGSAWRIAGLGANPGNGGDPLLLNFQDPAEVERIRKETRNEVDSPPRNPGSAR
jgi:hypothetical protein